MTLGQDRKYCLILKRIMLLMLFFLLKVQTIYYTPGLFLKVQHRNLLIHFFLTSISILPLYKKKIQFIWSVFQQWNQRNPSFKCYQLNLMTCILTQRHMWSPLSIIALPGGDSRDLFSRHWHNIDMYLTPNIGVICSEIFTKCPWLQTLSFFCLYVS